MKTKEKSNKGITLIVLVITIIILLILAGITIAAVSQSGILSRANKAKKTYGAASAKEYVEIKISDLQADKWVSEGRAAELKDLNELDDTTSNNYTEKITLKTPVKEGDTSAILIYDGYEVEIDSDVKVSKVNGENYNGNSGTSGDNSNSGNNTNKKDDVASVKSDIQVTLADGMIPIKYSSGWYICSKDDPEWFDYEKKLYANITLMDDLATDKHTNEQIKAMTTREQLESLAGDKITTYGSMFVWIPRYAYKITSGYHQGGSYTGYSYSYVSGGTYRLNEREVKVSGTTSIKFIDTDNYYRDGSGKVTNFTSAAYYDYVVNPAFDWGEVKLEGIWVAKYEASVSDTQNYNDDYAEVKYVPGKNVGNKGDSLDPYVGMNMNECIARAKLLTPSSDKNYYGTANSVIDAHLMKNVDWGAVTYMAYDSNYGTVPSVVTSQTLHGGSMNGNETGIYDMAGKNWEYVAGYVKSSSSTKSDENATYRYTLYSLADKYKDIYPAVSTSYYQADPSLIMDECYSKIGDAMFETGRCGTDDYNAWDQDWNDFPRSDWPCIVRGGAYNMGTGAGLCAVGCEIGRAMDYISFRSSIVIPE